MSLPKIFEDFIKAYRHVGGNSFDMENILQAWLSLMESSWGWDSEVAAVNNILSNGGFKMPSDDREFIYGFITRYAQNLPKRNLSDLQKLKSITDAAWSCPSEFDDEYVVKAMALLKDINYEFPMQGMELDEV